MTNDMTRVISLSRVYVAMCNKTNFEGFYFRKFYLPMDYINNAEKASWYFLNRLDFQSCIEGVIPYEDYINIKEVNALHITL
jgi:hypothetical protein